MGERLTKDLNCSPHLISLNKAVIQTLIAG